MHPQHQATAPKSDCAARVHRTPPRWSGLWRPWRGLSHYSEQLDWACGVRNAPYARLQLHKITKPHQCERTPRPYSTLATADGHCTCMRRAFAKAPAHGHEAVSYGQILECTNTPPVPQAPQRQVMIKEEGRHRNAKGAANRWRTRVSSLWGSFQVHPVSCLGLAAKFRLCVLYMCTDTGGMFSQHMKPC